MSSLRKAEDVTRGDDVIRWPVGGSMIVQRRTVVGIGRGDWSDTGRGMSDSYRYDMAGVRLRLRRTMTKRKGWDAVTRGP